MAEHTYRFKFDPTVALTEAEMTLHLALYAAEGLFGQARVRLEARYDLDHAGNTIAIRGGSEVGEAVVKVFASLVMREFGEHAFEVRPTPSVTPVPEEVAP